MIRDPFYRQSLKQAGLIALCFALCKVTHGYFIVLSVLLGLLLSLMGRNKGAAFFTMMIPLYVIINPLIVPKDGSIIGLTLRFGALGMWILQGARGASTHRGQVIPIGALWFYLLVSVVSSFNGWCPKVSYMKMIFFSTLLFCIWQAFRNLWYQDSLVHYMRTFIMGFAIILILGSLATLASPAIAYTTSLRGVIAEEGVAAANAEFAARGDIGAYGSLFSGIIYHSQDLAPVLAATFTLVLCDMLFVERKVRRFHLLLLVVALPLLYMTRSRVAFFSLATGVGMVVLYAAKKIALPLHVKIRIRRLIVTGSFVLVLLMVGAELKGRTISRWLRKNDNVAADSRSLGEALTASRQGKLEMCMNEFYLNPVFGMGFQVDEHTQMILQRSKGMVLSAPIEKGVLPVMVLGESGIVGFFVFLCFLISFFTACKRKRLFVTATMLTVFAATNMGEATFFSPGGTGGFMWTLCMFGGFTIDNVIRMRNGQVGPVNRMMR